MPTRENHYNDDAITGKVNPKAFKQHINSQHIHKPNQKPKKKTNTIEI